MSTIGPINPLLPTPPGRVSANYGLYRSNLATISLVNDEIVSFKNQEDDVRETERRPYTIFHPLRPFLSIGYGRSCHLRGSGVGRGDDVDSGSYGFMTSQAKYML